VTRLGSIVVIGAALAPAILLQSEDARADVALCASFPTPASDAQALRRAPFAFDGVVIGGRETSPSAAGEELVSPLTLRVVRWIKGGPSSASLPAGARRIHLWDGRYARLPDEVLHRYSTDVRPRFPGEIAARRGQPWRIYGTNENGVNFTCTNLLGSHPLGRTGSDVPTPEAGGRNVLATVVFLGIAAVLLSVWAVSLIRRPR
jgi:hypothetical protein